MEWHHQELYSWLLCKLKWQRKKTAKTQTSDPTEVRWADCAVHALWEPVKEMSSHTACQQTLVHGPLRC